MAKTENVPVGGSETPQQVPDPGFKFNNPDVEAKYSSVFGIDKTVSVIPLYTGKLSNITMKAADRMYDAKDNQLALKKP